MPTEIYRNEAIALAVVSFAAGVVVGEVAANWLTIVCWWILVIAVVRFIYVMGYGR